VRLLELILPRALASLGDLRFLMRVPWLAINFQHQFTNHALQIVSHLSNSGDTESRVAYRMLESRNIVFCKSFSLRQNQAIYSIIRRPPIQQGSNITTNKL